MTEETKTEMSEEAKAVTEAQYPEHAKLKAIGDKSQAVGEFLEWLGGEGLHVCEVSQNDGESFVPARMSVNDLLAEHFDIDPKKLEEEKQAMLAAIRSAMFPQHEPGTKVIAVSHSEDDKVFIFGHGEYIGDKVPGEDDLPETPGSFMGAANPCIKLDNGKYVWGCECWWGPEEVVKQKFSGKEEIVVDIDERRKEVIEARKKETTEDK